MPNPGEQQQYHDPAMMRAAMMQQQMRMQRPPMMVQQQQQQMQMRPNVRPAMPAGFGQMPPHGQVRGPDEDQLEDLLRELCLF
jgi:hypothetical protein